jgi:hypothetical protein
MPINPIRKRQAEDAPVHRTMQEWCDYANAHLASIGRAHELEWVIRNGTTHIQWKR